MADEYPHSRWVSGWVRGCVGGCVGEYYFGMHATYISVMILRVIYGSDMSREGDVRLCMYYGFILRF